MSENQAATETASPAEDEVLERTEFRLECRVDIDFDASDIARTLTPLQMLELTEEIDEEAGLWEYSILAYRHFLDQLNVAVRERPDLVAMTDEELELRLRQHEEKSK